MSDGNSEVNPDLEVVRVERGAPEAEPLARMSREAFAGLASSPVDELEKPWARVWVARDKHADGSTTPVGFLVAWHVVDELHVLHVATATELRRRGIGSALVAEAMAYAMRSEVRLCLLEVRRSNIAAIRLYEKHGFVVENVRPRYYSDNDEDALEMWRVLER